MADAEKIKTIIHEALPTIKQAMVEYSHPEIKEPIPESLQLSLPWCGPVSVAIQNYLREKYSIESEVVNNKLDHGIDPNLPVLGHVALRVDNVMIDATPTQFMDLVGLTPAEAVKHDIAHLYPEQQAFVYDFDQYREVANAFADHAYTVDQAELVPRHDAERIFIGSMRGKSRDEMQRVYQGIWNPDNYAPWPEEDRRQATRDAADFLTKKLNQ